MGCDIDLLIEFVYGNLHRKPLNRVLNHLESCQECRGSLLVLARLGANRLRVTAGLFLKGAWLLVRK